MKRGTFLTLAALLAMPQLAATQSRQLEAQLRPYLASPELVMRYQRRLNITDDQREAISAKVTELQAGILDLQWELEGKSHALVEIVSRDTVDVTAAIQQFDRVLEIEASIKRNHIRLLLEIRNALDPEQRRQLQEIVKEAQLREIGEETLRRREGERELRHHNPIQ